MYWSNWAKLDLGSTKMGAIIMMATIKYEGPKEKKKRHDILIDRLTESQYQNPQSNSEISDITT
ncbi:hypothetical protein DERF_000976 [Dermatophagoides farinae]|uniref:Uncharacterized protein n=1 Tax=Dermatophagoides farinae TaxID=6954 RepID=A0A922IBB7_DERFA|nr:hypothetical protein DERF_000976 [Dermatophagoides farinae]